MFRCPRRQPAFGARRLNERCKIGREARWASAAWPAVRERRAAALRSEGDESGVDREHEPRDRERRDAQAREHDCAAAGDDGEEDDG